MLSPRAFYARPASVTSAYILFYVLFFAALIAVAASASATGRITLSLLLSLSLCWIFVPLLHVGTAAALVATAASARLRGGRAVALLLMGHAPWSLWLVAASAMVFFKGFALYPAALLLALAPIALTFRIVNAFCIEVLGLPPRAAFRRALVHQAVTWLIAAAYLDRAVSLVPRIQGWLS